ncbi:unnamed protein product, partial [Mesorhabditis spiculigera]
MTVYPIYNNLRGKGNPPPHATSISGTVHTQLVYCGACESVCVCVSATQQATIRLQEGRSYAGGARSPLSPHRLVWDLTSSVPSSSSAYDLPSGSGPSTKLLNQAPGLQTTPFDAADRRKERQQKNSGKSPVFRCR